MSLDDINNCHTLAVLSIPPGSRILDVGAADGSVAKALRDRGCRVWAVEVDEAAARVASQVCEQVVVGDIETIDLRTSLEQIDFDFILMLDVLEHLRDPLATLRNLVPLLGPSGRIIASIPNVAHATVKLQLLQGRWAYTELGLLDRTHLRFFDKVSIEQLFADADLTIVETLRVIRSVSETEIDIDVAAFPSEIIDAATADPESTTYQFVIVATPNPDAGANASGWYGEKRVLEIDAERSQGGETTSLSEVMQARIRELEAIVRDGERYAATLLAQMEQMRATQREAESYAESLVAQINEKNKHEAYARELEGVLRQRMAELETLHDEVKHLRMDLAVRDAYVADLRAELLDAASNRVVPEEFERLRAEMERLRALEFRVANSAGYRLVDRSYNGLRRIPGLFQIMRAVARLLGRRRARTG